MRHHIYLSIILVLALLLPGLNVIYAKEKAPFFTIPRWDTGKQVSLDDFRGKILVLDFFSAGCVKCFRASLELEIDIQDMYAGQSGNSHGIPVQVVGVNSDLAEPEDMAVFMEETGLDPVLDDSGGTLLERYGGTTLPYLVIIDATGLTAPRVVYRQSDYQGTDELRDAIDKITGREELEASRSETMVEISKKTVDSLSVAESGKRIIQESTLDINSLTASDVYVTDTLAEYRRKQPSMEFTLSVSYRRIKADYVSEYLSVRREKQLSADHIDVQGSAYFDLDEKFTLKFEGGAYDGYQTYRALWLDEYYRQMFDVLSQYISGLEGYREADPRGYNLSTGVRWEYLPDSGFAEGGISYQHDIVSPGYEAGVPVIRLRDKYDTLTGRLSFENILTRRLRTLLECRIDDTTDRDSRFTALGALNYALTEHWVTRLTAAASKENPDFKSKSISAVLEHDWYGTWFLSLFGRYYEDTSEIANAVVSNAAPPPLETYQAGLGLRCQGHRYSFKFVVGPCFSRYKKLAQRERAFDQLYSDREWFSFQFAFLHQF